MARRSPVPDPAPERLAVALRLALPSDAPLVLRVTQEAFAEYRRQPNPSSVLAESVRDIERFLSDGAVLLATVDGSSRACVRFRLRRPDEHDRAGHLMLSRLGVLPAWRGLGIARRMLDWLDDHARRHGLSRIKLRARSQQPDNRPFWIAQGFGVTGTSDCYGLRDMVTHMERAVSEPSPGIPPHTTRGFGPHGLPEQ